MIDKRIALIIPDFDYGGEESRVVFFANMYVNYFSHVILIAPWGKSCKLLDKQIQHVVCNVRGLHNLPKVMKILKDNQISVLQGHKRRTLPYLYGAEKLLGVKAFFNFDNIYPSQNRLYSYISPSRIVYLSDHLKDFYSPYYTKSTNTTINMGGIFMERFSIEKREEVRKNLGISDTFVLLSLGRLSPQKNHHLLLKALYKIKDENFVCIIAGDGELDSDLKVMANELGLSNKVRFLGHRSDVENLLNSADVLVQSSDFEGFPNVFIEATSTGLPIISTDVGSARSLVMDNGILVSKGNSDEMALAIKQVMNESKYYKNASVRMKNSEYFQGFTREAMLSGYLNYIHQL